MRYVCRKCGESYEARPDVIKCRCGAALWLDFKGSLKRSDIDQKDFSMWRYSAAYPLEREDIRISFGEGMSPLAVIDYRGLEILVKQDNLLPTGSFKDRGAAMVINFLNSFGVSTITEDSSGNGGAAFAGYSALGGIRCRVFIPAGTSEGKIAQTRAYGTELIEVRGSRADVADAAMKSIGGSVYAGHNWHPLFVQGTKSAAYEIWEQNGFRAPDNVVCVCGNGSMAAGLCIGFDELLSSGEIDRIPRIHAIQADNCNPFYRAFVGDTAPFEPEKTIAEGISIRRSSKHDEVLSMVRETGGTFQSASEEEIKSALLEIAGKGFFIEPTSATGFAGLNKLIDSKIIEKDQSTAIIISGNGLKATDKIMKMF